MAMPAVNRGNRQKRWYAVIVDGLEIALVKTFKLPTLEYEISKFGGAGSYWDQKEAGRMVIGEAELGKAVKSGETDSFTWNQFIKALGMPPSVYKNRDWTICETDETGKYKRQWVLRNAWGQKIDMEEFDGMSSEPVIEKLTVACDQVDFKNL